jgi:alkylhydroperoxidase family enzyme
VQLTIHTLDDAPVASKQLLEGISSDIGFIPNMAGVAAGAPALLRAFDGMRRAVRSGVLDPVAREVTGLAVGVAVDNRYGVAFHSTVLGSLGLADDEIERLRAGQAPADAKLAAIAELARDVTLERGKSEDAVRRATAAGWSEEEILEVVAECAFAGLVGVLDNLAGRVPLDAFLAPRAWDRAPDGRRDPVSGTHVGG